MTRSIDDIVADFDLLDDWEDRYRYVIELGRALPDMAEADKTDQNKVNGCVSQVWLVAEGPTGADRTITFRGESDAHIVRGLVAIMISALSGKTADDILAYDTEALLKRIGLDSHLTPQRSNGLRAMVDKMRSAAQFGQAA